MDSIAKCYQASPPETQYLRESEFVLRKDKNRATTYASGERNGEKTEENNERGPPNEDPNISISSHDGNITETGGPKGGDLLISGDVASAKKLVWDESLENPLNWSYSKRIWQIINTAILAWLVTFASSVYAPGSPQVAERFQVSEMAAFLGISLYTLGLGLGPVLAAPMSETFGRNVVYKASAAIFMLFTLGAGFSDTFAALCACRFFAGMAGAPVLAVAGGTIADVLPKHIRGVATGIFLLASFLGLSSGPFIGGFVAQYKG